MIEKEKVFRYLKSEITVIDSATDQTVCVVPKGTKFELINSTLDNEYNSGVRVHAKNSEGEEFKLCAGLLNSYITDSPENIL